VLGFLILGKDCGIMTVYCSIVLSLENMLFERLIPLNGTLTEYPLLELVYAVLLTGIGAAMIFKCKASSGGTDIVALIVNKYRTISYGRILFMTDFIIIGSSLLVTRDIQMVIFGYVVVAACGYTADAVLAGDKKSSQLMIMSKNHDAIADAIVNDLHRGCTVMDGTGWFTKEPTKVVMVLCRKNETSTILRTVKRVDPDAFISNASVTGVYGRGFEEIKR
jgi:uncharacterized membrane-anchored protein YitT (DUF2179 family)